MLYVIIADNTFDQVCDTKQLAQREKRDLEKMGCTVRIKPVADWSAANALEDKMANR